MERGKRILASARYAPWAIGGLCVLLFGFGLVLGLRSGLSGKQWKPFCVEKPEPEI